jgi:hypothetical protein
LAQAELDIAQRHEKAQFADTELHSRTKAETDKLISDSEKHAAEAEQRAADALAKFEQIRRDSDAYARETTDNARQQAEQILQDARERAEEITATTQTTTAHMVSTAKRQVDDLNAQRESITTYLDELRSILASETIPNEATLQRVAEVEENFVAAEERREADFSASEEQATDDDGVAILDEAPPAPDTVTFVAAEFAVVSDTESDFNDSTSAVSPVSASSTGTAVSASDGSPSASSVASAGSAPSAQSVPSADSVSSPSSAATPAISAPSALSAPSAQPGEAVAAQDAPTEVIEIVSEDETERTLTLDEIEAAEDAALEEEILAEEAEAAAAQRSPRKTTSGRPAPLSAAPGFKLPHATADEDEA